MKDADYLRKEYNERFKDPVNRWTSENLYRCSKIAGRIIRWTGTRSGKRLKMLDVGCATGFYTKAFYLKGFEAFGLDYSDVAILKAVGLHPECQFIHADGFNPSLDMKFDLILCRGFSGANTHDLKYVSEWTDKYIDLLTDKGKFVFSYSSDFTGSEAEGETVNWSKNEIRKFIGLVKAKCIGVRIYYEYYFISLALLYLPGIFKRKVNKRYFYIIFSR
jgi:SAM-dependent methyltransferase